MKKLCICGNASFYLFRDLGSSKIYRCTKCGLGKRHPFLLDLAYTDDFIPRVERFDTWEVIHHAMLSRVEKFIKPGRMIEVGCAEGIPLVVAKKRGWKAEGFEFSKKAAVYGKKNFGLDIMQGDFEKYNVAPLKERYDLVTFDNVLEHLYDPLSALKKARVMLKDGGVVLVTLPNINSIWAKIFKEKWYNWQANQHLWHFNAKSLEQLLENAGFTVFYSSNITVFEPYVFWQKRFKELVSFTFSYINMGDALYALAKKDS